MQTNAHTGTTIDEVAAGIYRINTPLRIDSIPGGFNLSQYLIVDDEPMIFHTGCRLLQAGVSTKTGTHGFLDVGEDVGAANSQPNGMRSMRLAIIDYELPKDVNIDRPNISSGEGDAFFVDGSRQLMNLSERTHCRDFSSGARSGTIYSLLRQHEDCDCWRIADMELPTQTNEWISFRWLGFMRHLESAHP